MNEQIATIAERDALPVGSIVIDAYAATCIRARISDPAMPSDWVRVTSAVRGGEHHHGPFLPADVERVGWSSYQSTPDGAEPTEEQEPTEGQIDAMILGMAVIVPAVTEQIRALHASNGFGDCRECDADYRCPTVRLCDELDAAARGEQP